MRKTGEKNVSIRIKFSTSRRVPLYPVSLLRDFSKSSEGQTEKDLKIFGLSVPQISDLINFISTTTGHSRTMSASKTEIELLAETDILGSEISP